MFFHSMVASLTPDHPATPHVAEFLGRMDANPPQTQDECLAAYDSFAQGLQDRCNHATFTSLGTPDLAAAVERGVAVHVALDIFRQRLIDEWKLMFGEKGRFRQPHEVSPIPHGG